MVASTVLFSKGFCPSRSALKPIFLRPAILSHSTRPFPIASGIAAINRFGRSGSSSSQTRYSRIKDLSTLRCASCISVRKSARPFGWPIQRPPLALEAADPFHQLSGFGMHVVSRYPQACPAAVVSDPEPYRQRLGVDVSVRDEQPSLSQEVGAFGRMPAIDPEGDRRGAVASFFACP